MTLIADRIIRASRLDPDFYREVKTEPAALGPAMAVVLLSSLSAGIGSLNLGLEGLFVGTFAALAGWFIWVLVIYVAGARLMAEPRTRTSFGEVVRTAGFASAPGMIRVLAAVPYLGGLVVFVASIWILMAMITAARQSLGFASVWRTVGVCLLGWVIQGAALAPFLVMMAPMREP